VRCGIISKCGETSLVETMRTIISYQKMTLMKSVITGSGHLSIWMKLISKEFLEYLQQLMRDIDSGKVKTYPMENVMEELKQWMENPDDEDT
jgi:hypothetical protein